MRARVLVGFSICFAAAALGPWACIPHPEQDFDDYQERIANIPKSQIDASAFEAAAPPAEPVKGLYYGACLSELAFNQVSKVFNFYTNTEFTPSAQGNKLTLSIQALKVKSGSFPPDTITSADISGGIIKAPALVDREGKFRLELGTVTIPGDCNPISGSNVLIENTVLIGRFAADRICARLGGDVRQPAASARSLNIDKNVCQFVPIQEGAKRPEVTLADLQAEACPL
jgi:hypothetical protein